MISPELKEAVMSDIVLMQLVGINVVVVHGGGPEISGMLKKIGKESKFVNGCGIPTPRRWILYRWCWRARSIKRWSRCWNSTAGNPWACAA